MVLELIHKKTASYRMLFFYICIIILCSSQI